MLCNLVANKNNRLGILQTFLKNVYKKSYLVWSFMDFKVYELGMAITKA
jgi:hypothetical protein